MGKDYVVQFAKKLDGVDNYGNVTYSVKFTTESDSVLWKVQPQTVIEPGTTAYGHIEQRVSQNGKQYHVFKRDKKEDVGGFTSSGNRPTTGNQDSRQDGMRQGMCINNAVAIINTFIQTGVYSTSDPVQIVQDIERYARELYKVDLSKAETKQADKIVDVTDEMLGTPVSLDDIPGF